MFLNKNIQYFLKLNKHNDSIGALMNQTHYSIEDILLLEQSFNMPIQKIISVDLEMQAKIKQEIKMLILDIDGVMTDAGMYYTENGDEFKRFNSKDGLAIRRLTKKGFQVGIISNGKNNKLIESRAQLLGIQNVYVGKDEKVDVLKLWLKNLNIQPENIAYIGDDLNDLNIMNYVGFTACPADASNEVKNTVNVVLSKSGGYACVREFCDNYLL